MTRQILTSLSGVPRELQAPVAVGAGEGHVSPVAFGTLCLGRLDEAPDWIQRSIEERRGWFVYTRVKPICDPLRDHQRALLSDLA